MSLQERKRPHAGACFPTGYKEAPHPNFEQAGSSARELILRGRNKKAIITFCREIDGMLGGGVPRGELTEVLRFVHAPSRFEFV